MAFKLRSDENIYQAKNGQWVVELCLYPNDPINSVWFEYSFHTTRAEAVAEVKATRKRVKP